MLHHPNRKPVVERGSRGCLIPTSELWEHAKSVGTFDSHAPTEEAGVEAQNQSVDQATASGS